MKKISRFVLIVFMITMLFSSCGKENEMVTSGGRPIEAKPKQTTEVNENVSKVTFESKILGKDMKFNIYLPTGYSTSKKYPTLYILHGYSGTEESWVPLLGMDAKAEKLLEAGAINPLIIVSPDIENSYGINSAKEYSTYGGNDRDFNLSQGMFEDYLYTELIPFVDGNYSTDAKRESRYIGGLSMGGFAALHLAFKHPDLFSKAGGHSPALFLNEFPRGLDSWLYPDEQKRKERDPMAIAQTAKLSNLSVYLDCGDQDSFKFYEGCEKLNDILQEKKVQSQYFLNKGAHDGEYWLANGEAYLKFYAGKEQNAANDVIP